MVDSASCPSFNTPSLTRSPPPDAPVVPAARFGIRLIRDTGISATSRQTPAFRRAFRGRLSSFGRNETSNTTPGGRSGYLQGAGRAAPNFHPSGRLPEPAAPAAAGLRNPLRKRRGAPLPEGGLPERAAPAPGFRSCAPESGNFPTPIAVKAGIKCRGRRALLEIVPNSVERELGQGS